MNHLEQYRKSLESSTLPRSTLIEKYITIRQQTIRICESLEIEDYVVQPTEEVSPPKWHLGHTTWFFEEFLLVQFLPGYGRLDENYKILFNSYYKTAGTHWLQGERGLLSRPTVRETLEYRSLIDQRVILFLENSETNPEVDFLLEVGLHHEQQHQELLLMDIKYILGTNPMAPSFSKTPLTPSPRSLPQWLVFGEGLYEIGQRGDDFAYDNEGPLHKSYLYPFSIRSDFVSNGEYLQFMEDKGYSTPHFWLSEGWDWLTEHSVRHPLYWRLMDNQWFEFTLHGLVPLDLAAPVSHISYFEADAFANWTGHRLPTEQELETFLRTIPDSPSSYPELYHPHSAGQSVRQLWCWTKSHYSGYPGYRTFKGALGEYNGKFMCNQFVLRGGSMATPIGHYRHSYRNFFQPHQRWMFSGIRLTKDD